MDIGGDAAVVAAALEGDGEVVELAVVLDKARRGFRLDTLVNILPRGLVGQVADGEVGDAEGFGLGIALELEGSVISSASGTERGEVFYGPTDWLGSRDPMTPYDTRVARRPDWLTETLTIPLTDRMTHKRIMLTV